MKPERRTRSRSTSSLPPSSRSSVAWRWPIVPARTSTTTRSTAGPDPEGHRYGLPCNRFQSGLIVESSHRSGHEVARASRGSCSFGNDPDLFRGYASTLSRHLGITAPLAVVVTGRDVRTDRDSAGEDSRDDGDGACGDRDGCRDLVPPGLRPT